MSKIDNYEKVIANTNSKIENYQLLVAKIDKNDETSKALLAKYKKGGGSNNKIEAEENKLSHNAKKRVQVLKNIEEFKTVISKYEVYIQREKNNE